MPFVGSYPATKDENRVFTLQVTAEGNLKVVYLDVNEVLHELIILGGESAITTKPEKKKL